jgi:hypothetical protein
MEDGKRCSAELPLASYSLHHKRCSRLGKVFADGNWYCGIHDPARIKARREAKESKFLVRINEASRQHDRMVALAAACEGVADPQPGELLRLRQELAKIKGGA